VGGPWRLVGVGGVWEKENAPEDVAAVGSVGSVVYLVSE
jgi:hypothetical protein